MVGWGGEDSGCLYPRLTVLMISKSFQIWLSFQVLSAERVMLFNFGANLRWPFDAKIKGKGTTRVNNKRFLFKRMRRFQGALVLLQHNFFQASVEIKSIDAIYQ